jgi:hypothetical protein
MTILFKSEEIFDSLAYSFTWNETRNSAKALICRRILLLLLD